MFTFLLLFVVLFFVFGVIGLVLKITGIILNGVLKIIFHPIMFLVALGMMAWFFMSVL